MTSPFASFITVTFVDAGEADPAHAALAGTTFKLPPEYTTPPAGSPGSGPTNPGILGTEKVRGYLRTELTGSLSWVMTGEITAAQKTQLLAIAPGLSWVNRSMAVGTPLRVFFAVGRQLRQAGIPGPDILDPDTGILKRLYDAAVANRDQQIAAGG